MKNCTVCHMDKREKEFSISKNGKRRSECKECSANRAREWRKNNKARLYAYVKQWQKDNPDKRREHAKRQRDKKRKPCVSCGILCLTLNKGICRKCTSDIERETRRLERRRIQEENKTKRLAEKEIMRVLDEAAKENKRRDRIAKKHRIIGGKAYTKCSKCEEWRPDEVFYKTMPGTCKECALSTSRQWRLENIDKERAREKRNRRKKERRRRARHKNAEGSHTDDEFNALKSQYNYLCLKCGRTEPEIRLTEDHIIPIGPPEGGTDNINNIQPLCVSCNSSKGRTTADYRPT